MRLLVLGGTSFVGRTVVTAAVARGWSVTTFNRGLGAWAHPAVERVLGDRLIPDDLGGIRSDRWDAVVDTWAGAPWVVRDSATALAGRVERYVYVSSRAVYAPPVRANLDESFPTVEASPDADATEYAVDKRGAEIAIQNAFGEGAVLARAGLILGPYEDRGRLPDWLRRCARGGPVLAPGPPEQAWQTIDVRDLAAWMLDAVERRVSGPFNLVEPQGRTTTRRLLEAAAKVTGGGAELVWVGPQALEAAGVHRWTELPGWIAPEPALAGFLSTRVDRALAAGLRCRPIEATVSNTWAWMRSDDGPPEAPPGLDPAKEAEILAAWGQIAKR